MNIGNLEYYQRTIFLSFKSFNSNKENQYLIFQPQSEGERRLVTEKYTSSKQYLVTKSRPTVALGDLELRVREGDILGVIQQKDPLGNRGRWFCDNGAAKGFVEADCLVQHHPVEDPDLMKPVAVVAPYDEVTEDEYKKPTRKAPPVPRAGKSRCDQMSVHSYEEIGLEPSEAVLETMSADLSPLYEEIPGGSRCSVSSSSGSGRSEGRKSPRGKFYYAQFSFVPETCEQEEEEEVGGSAYVPVSRGQVVRVIAVSGDWWFVEDRKHCRGYVPANYLLPYYNTH